MKQVFYKYTLWEDFQNGMYKDNNDGMKELRIEQAVEMFKNSEVCYKEMKYVSSNWKISAEVNFTNPSVNKQAWIGQAACCHYCGCSDMETIQAWHKLNDEEKNNANKIADRVFYEWLDEYEKEYNLFDYLKEIEGGQECQELC